MPIGARSFPPCRIETTDLIDSIERSGSSGTDLDSFRSRMDLLNFCVALYMYRKRMKKAVKVPRNLRKNRTIS